MSSNLIERIYRWLLEEGLEEFSGIIDDLELIKTSSGMPVKVRVMIDSSFLEIYWSERKVHPAPRAKAFRRSHL